MSPAELAAYRGPILVTAAYFGLWYTMLFGLQTRTKYRLRDEYAARGEVFDRYFGQDRRMLAADRAVTNTQEQMVPFLAGLWMHSVFVSTTHAAALGAVYVLLRAIYPVLLGAKLSETQSKRVFLVTGPCYAIVAYLVVGTVAVAVTTG
ncbi:MAG: MAPEG family protein [Proteobacteria bacterium]|nr:MAPEG family protein [Pseudomonadota bacterium]